MRVWLLDLDGVLVRPGGYRAAFRATLEHLAGSMSLGYAWDEAIPEAFEAHGITSEWDSVPICLAGLTLEAVRQGVYVDLTTEFRALPPHAGPARTLPLSLDFMSLAQRVAEAQTPGELPSQAALRLFLDEVAAEPAFVDRLPALTGALTALLRDTRAFPASASMLVFQHYALGSRAFERTYGTPAVFETPSMIELHDRSELAPGAASRLLSAVACGELCAAVYTLRPSLPPRELSDRRLGYSPEAELAVKLTHLDGLPLIGYGRLRWLETLLDVPSDSFAKPSPVHALAGIFAAIRGNEVEALRSAHAFALEGKLPPWIQPLTGEHLALSVFEDSPAGIRGAREAAERLRRTGLRVVFRGWGIAGGGEKGRALAEAGAEVFPTLGEAIKAGRDLPGL